MSWRVFKRDVARLGRVRKSWIIVIGVLVTPALYAWFNINAFWDPYANTENINIAVVNLDEGAESELTGPIDVGSQVVEQLEDNDQLGWKFMDEATGQAAVRDGSVYATIVIPEDFSEHLISITTGEFTQPALEYFVNEKASAIAPKITDVGASQLDKQITSAFTSQVAEATTEALRDVADTAEARLLDAKGSSITAFDEAGKTIGDARKTLAKLTDSLDSSRDTVASAKTTLGDVGKTLGDVQTAIAQAQSIIDEAQDQVIAFTDAATTAYVDGTAKLADASAAAKVTVTELTNSFQQASARIDAAIDDVNAVIDANRAVIADLQALVDDPDTPESAKPQIQSVIDALNQRVDADQGVLDSLTQLNGSVSGAVTEIDGLAGALNDAAANAADAAKSMRDVLTGSAPALSRAMTALSTSAGAFSAAIDAQQGQLTQAVELLGGLDTQLASTADALTNLDRNFAGVEKSVKDARTDVLALGAASEWGSLRSLTGLDAEGIAQFVAAPVEVDEIVLFPIASYGSAMAALFTNLSLWIGAFVLMVIFKIEVDTEEVEGVTVRQAYLGRFMLFGVLAAAQALIVCIGNLIIGVQTVSAFAYVGTGVFTALAYMSIVYALCVSFGHVGRGLCILLVIMQIPGASGLYPIEMMPGFFRAIYPFLPFTYGIDAMRETIAGFYDLHFLRCVAVLLVFVMLSFVLGLVLRSRLANANMMFNREIAETDLLIGEDVQVTRGSYRLTDVIRAMSDRDDFREDLARRAQPFTRHYPAFLRAILLTGLGGLIVLGIIAWLLPGGKATMLGIWLLWCLIIIGFLVSVEYVKQSFDLAAEVASLDDSDLREAVLSGGPRRRGTLSLESDEPLDGRHGAGGAQRLLTEDLDADDPLDGSGEGSSGAAQDPGGEDIDEVIAQLFSDAGDTGGDPDAVDTTPIDTGGQRPAPEAGDDSERGDRK